MKRETKNSKCFKFHASSFMRFLPQNPKTKNLALILIAGGFLLFAFGFFYITYFAPASPSEGATELSGTTQKAISEQAVKKLDDDITDITNELGNDFYKRLVPHPLKKDAAVAGRNNPFLK